MKGANPLARLIAAVTGATGADAAQVEVIMREEIFHSTLDWQTREQLEDGARQAMGRLAADREWHEQHRAQRIQFFEQMQAGRNAEKGHGR